jgi:pSer/pThr/pTyr-binding forkhead associated (FHA) protein
MPTLIAVYGPDVVTNEETCIFYSWDGEDLPVAHIGRVVVPGLHLPKDDTVSKMHALVRVTPEGCTLEDRGSENGTLVQQHGALVPLMCDAGQAQAVERYLLKNEESFFVGNTQIVFLDDEMDPAWIRSSRSDRYTRGMRDARSLPRLPRKDLPPTIKIDPKKPSNKK